MFNMIKKPFVALLGLVGLATTSQAAPLAVDTTAISADIATASASGLEITLLVAAAVIAIGVVKKLVRP